MKNSAWIIAIIALTISACTSQKQATSYVNDDVYNSNPKYQQPTASAAPASTQGAQVITAPDKAKAQKPASSTLADDYNDYSYSSRISRFSNQDTTVGYFDDALTQSSAGGSQPNVNIYLGAGAGYGGFYSSPFSYGMGWGYPYSNWGWDNGWGYPYYGGYYGWGYPYYGYSPWYSPYYDPWYSSCCYCYGNNDWYTPYDRPSSYYGSRRSLYGTDGGSIRNSRSSAYSPGNSGNAAYGRNVSTSNNRVGTSDRTPSPRTAGQSVRTVPASQEKYRYSRPSNERQTNYQRTTKPSPGQVQNQITRQQPTPRYIRPENAGNNQRTESVQSYTSPVYRQPKSSQEYIAPRSQNPRITRESNQNSEIRSGSGSSGTITRQGEESGNSRRTYTTPTRSGSSGFSTQPRSSQENRTPVRSGNNNSYTPPARSNNSGSYSPPVNSNNGGSYSAPSRSGGNSGGSSGGSSGSGGRHR